MNNQEMSCYIANRFTEYYKSSIPLFEWGHKDTLETVMLDTNLPIEATLLFPSEQLISTLPIVRKKKDDISYLDNIATDLNRAYYNFMQWYPFRYHRKTIRYIIKQAHIIDRSPPDSNYFSIRWYSEEYFCEG